ncbi:molybdenum ABC transporter ATP-binding protein [Arthrobacter alpinus]|uniref:Molybdenum ABC transporter ATP-binding protein n=1 Tax=Arthrobacter alpinus TaxID=656366 RepID=A0A0S2LXT5_9MICC|nr:ABC transporter ATP-binding protein [Arthrobacter alpinus]ALO66258.1 molybdenum ABC transporter ATP-binding protein [Arthrobacter alpinus]
MTLELSMAIGARNLDLALSVGPAETVALMGANGAGKSSVLQALSGLVKPDAGHATLGGRPLFRVGSAGFGETGGSGGTGSTWLPPHKRGIGTLAQEPLLFPHLSVLDNVAFGPRSAGATKAAAATTALQWLREVDAGELAERKPAQLSGGQAQRVALARALATDPELLLLDEPMAALDVNTTPFLRSLLKRVLANRRAIIVTHDVLDALMLADRIIVMEQGRIVEAGPTAAVLAHPRSTFAASLAGLNVLTGSLSGSTLLMPDGVKVAGRPAGEALSQAPLPAPAPPTEGGPEGMAAFAPSSVSVFLSPPAGSPRNCFQVQVTELEPQGGHIRVRASGLAADVSPAAIAELGLEPGAKAFFVVKAAEVVLYPA